MKDINGLLLNALIGFVGNFLHTQSQAEELQLYFVHNDHLGTPVVVTDGNQKVVWAAEKTPFGETTVLVQGVEQPVRLPGQYFDEETGLHYNYYRDYDPGLGRYVQSDPIGILRDYRDPQLQLGAFIGILNESSHAGLLLNHPYGYANQSPLNNVDPKGLDVPIYNSYRNPFEGWTAGWNNAQNQLNQMANSASKTCECIYESYVSTIPESFATEYAAGKAGWRFYGKLGAYYAKNAVGAYNNYMSAIDFAKCVNN